MSVDRDFSSLPQKRVNYEEAFVKYCGGVPLEDISLMCDIPLSKLEAHARNAQWPTLKARVEAQAQSLVPVHADEIARRAEMIQQNREENLRGWKKLRDDAFELLDDLRETKGVDMITQYWHNRGAIIEKRRAMTISERVQLATYLQTIAQGTYAALGDRVSSSGAKDDVNSNPNGTPGITIILPGVIAKPRAERSVNGSDTTVKPTATPGGPTGQVIDLRDV